MSHRYATDWHQCTACGCTRADKELRQLRLVDPVLNLEDDVYRCVDVELCTRGENSSARTTSALASG
jgi:hypothetical protein